MPRRNFFQLTSSLLDVLKKVFFKPINRTKILNYGLKRPGRPWFLSIQSWFSYHQMNAGKRYNSNPISTKRFKLDRVAPVDNRVPIDKNGARNSGDLQSLRYKVIADY